MKHDSPDWPWFVGCVILVIFASQGIHLLMT
jgi:hypothetical protein